MEKRSVSTKTSRDVSSYGKDGLGERLRILLIGPFPTPIGGISVHIYRLSSWLSAHGIKVDLVELFGGGAVGIGMDGCGHEPGLAESVQDIGLGALPEEDAHGGIASAVFREQTDLGAEDHLLTAI